MVSSFGGGSTVAEPMIVWHSDSSQAQADIGNMRGRMQGFATTVRGAGIQMQMFGQGIMNLVGGVVGAFMTFEDAFIGVTRTVDATEEEFRLLEKGLRDMALVIPQTAADLADIMKIAGQMGIRGVDNLLIFTETMARMADTTDLTAESAARAFASMSVVLQEPIANIDRMGSVVVELGNNFATTEPLIVSAGLRASGAAKTLGLSTAEMLGIVAQSTVVMPRAQAAGSSLVRIWTEMAEAAFDGGTSLDRFAQLMHLTKEETADLILTNPAEAFKLFIKGTGEAVEAGENWVQILKDIGLNQIRTRELVLNLSGNYPELARAIAEATGEWEDNIALTEESERRYSSLSSQIQIFKNLIGEISIILGKALAPTIENVMDRLRPFFEAFRQFAEENPKLMGILGAIVAVIGALVFAAGTVLIIAAIVPVLGLLFTSASLAALSIMGVLTAITAIAVFWEDLNEQWQTFIGVAGGVAFALLSIKGILLSLPKIIKAVRVAWTAMTLIFAISNIWLALILLIVVAFAAFVALSPGLRDLAKQFGGLLEQLISGEITIQEFWDRLKIILKKLPGAFADAGRDFRNKLKELGVSIRNWLKEFGIDLRNRLKAVGISIRDWLIKFGKDVRDKLKEFGVFLRDWLVQTGNDIRDKIKEWATKVRNQLKEFGMGIKNTLRETFDFLITPVIKAWKEIWKTIQFWWPTYVAFIKGQINAWIFIFKVAFVIIRAIFRVVWPIIWGIITNAFNAIKDIVTTGWNTISTIFRVVWSIIVPIVKTAIAIIWNLIVFWFETLKNTFTTYFGILWNIIKIYWALFWGSIRIAILIISGIIRFVMAIIRGDWSAAWDAVKDTVVGVWDIIWETVKTVAGLIWDSIKKFWGFIKDETSDVWTLIKESVLDALRGMRDTGAAIFDGFITIIEVGISSIMKGISGLIGGFRKIGEFANYFPGNPGQPLIDAVDAVTGYLDGGITLPRILGKGGLVMGPTLAMVGDAGPELVIPLDQLQGLGQGQNFYGPVTQVIQAEDADHAFDIMKRIKT